MQLIRTRNGLPLTDEVRKELDLGKSPEVRAVYSAVLARLEREQGRR